MPAYSTYGLGQAALLLAPVRREATCTASRLEPVGSVGLKGPAPASVPHGAPGRLLSPTSLVQLAGRGDEIEPLATGSGGLEFLGAFPG